MTDEKLLELMRAVDPLTQRIPPGIRLLAFAIEAAERERCAMVCEGMHDEDRPSDYAYSIRSQ